MLTSLSVGLSFSFTLLIFIVSLFCLINSFVSWFNNGYLLKHRKLFSVSFVILNLLFILNLVLLYPMIHFYHPDPGRFAINTAAPFFALFGLSLWIYWLSFVIGFSGNLVCYFRSQNTVIKLYFKQMLFKWLLTLVLTLFIYLILIIVGPSVAYSTI